MAEIKELPNLQTFRDRLDVLDAQMQEPNFYSDARHAAAVSREHQKLSSLIEKAAEHAKLIQDLADNRSMIDDPEGDEELREMAAEEIPEIEGQLETLYNEILKGMIPPDPSDSRNTIIEIRAGTGGDEASLFAGDLFRMYSRFAEGKGWKIEPMSSAGNEVGGFKEVSFLVTGEDVYRALKFESGVHRVQRVPATEASGRIHTSAATEITVARASGPGGQGVNTTDSAVQILHKPTGMIVKCADERSQLKNKAKAMTVLRSRLLEQKEREEREKYAAERKNQVGSGDRSERIRTYNFPQGRVTDHRINLTLYSLTDFMEGQIEDVIVPLHEADEAAQLANLLERTEG